MDEVHAYNHLVFDFSKTRLNVIRDYQNEKIFAEGSDDDNYNDSNGDCDSDRSPCLSLIKVITNYIASTKTNKLWLKLNTTRFYKVTIDPLFDNKLSSSLSFNHASCN